MRKQIAAANWKMNLTYEQAEALLDTFLADAPELQQEQLVVLAVPFPYLAMAKQKIAGRTNFFIAGQNVYAKKSGAFTGETSVEMLHSMNIQYVVIGHSERREYFNEDNKLLADKVRICLEYSLVPIFCCGEPLPVREADGQNDFVTNQLEESLFGLTVDEVKQVVIAYEPIWAIGTGKTATSEQAQQMHAHIRSQLAGKYGAEVAEAISILYGGSVNAGNAKEIFGQPDVDGGLVGGASLKAQDFIQIVKALK